MKYMLLLRTRVGEGPEEGSPGYDAEMQAWGKLNEDLQAAGAWIHAAGLEMDDAATTVRTSGGDQVLSDGPFAETKELLFSFYIIDVADLDAAVGWAARMPATEYGSVEIRPLAAIEQGS